MKVTEFDFSKGGAPVIREVEVDDTPALDTATLDMLKKAGVTSMTVGENVVTGDCPDGLSIVKKAQAIIA